MTERADIVVEPGVENAKWRDTTREMVSAAMERDERIACTFDELSVNVPIRTGRDPPTAEWEFDGTVEVSVDGAAGPLADWLRWWRDRTSE